MENKQQNAVVVQRHHDLVFDSCCCCIPLKTGCFILGYLHLIGLIIGMITSVVGVGMAMALMNSEKGAQYRELGRVLLILLVVAMVMIVITLPFIILLLVGLHKEKRKYVKIYLIFAVICLVLTVILQIVKFAGRYGATHEIFTALLSMALNIYFLLVLRSQYIKMGETGIAVPDQRYHGGHIVTNTNPHKV